MVAENEKKSVETTSLPEGGKARRVYLVLRDEILSGAYPTGTQLPGEQTLAGRFGVSRVTIRSALAGLVSSDLLEKRTGSGSIIKHSGPREKPVAADISSLIPHIVEMGQATTARLISFSYSGAPETIAEKMGLQSGDMMQVAVRVRLADGKPFSHLTTYVPKEIAASYTEAELATTPLFKLLERSGLKIETAHQTVSATLASPTVAETLDIDAGAPLLSLNRVVYDSTGRGVEFLAALYRADMFSLEMDLARAHDGGAGFWRPIIADPTHPGTSNEEAAE